MKPSTRLTFERVEQRLALAGDTTGQGGYLRMELADVETAARGVEIFTLAPTFPSANFLIPGSTNAMGMVLSDLRSYGDSAGFLEYRAAARDFSFITSVVRGPADGFVGSVLAQAGVRSVGGQASVADGPQPPGGPTTVTVLPPKTDTATPKITGGTNLGSSFDPLFAKAAMSVIQPSRSEMPRNASAALRPEFLTPTQQSRMQALPITSGTATSERGPGVGAAEAPVGEGGPIDIGLAIEVFAPQADIRTALVPLAVAPRPVAGEPSTVELARAVVFSQPAQAPVSEPALPPEPHPDAPIGIFAPSPGALAPPLVVPPLPEPPVTLRQFSLSASVTAAVIWATHLLQPITEKAHASPPRHAGRRRPVTLAIHRGADRRA
jgi:hypothetical protein